MPLTSEQWQAQRTPIGVIRHGGHAHLHYQRHLAIWREKGCEGWMVGADELSDPNPRVMAELIFGVRSRS